MKRGSRECRRAAQTRVVEVAMRTASLAAAVYAWPHWGAWAAEWAEEVRGLQSGALQPV